jgi:hypothetical protein
MYQGMKLVTKNPLAQPERFFKPVGFYFYETKV